MSIQQLKDAGGISALELALNEQLRDTSPAKIVLSTVGASLFVAYLYSQITHKVLHVFVTKFIIKIV